MHLTVPVWPGLTPACGGRLGSRSTVYMACGRQGDNMLREQRPSEAPHVCCTLHCSCQPAAIEAWACPATTATTATATKPHLHASRNVVPDVAVQQPAATAQHIAE